MTPSDPFIQPYEPSTTPLPDLQPEIEPDGAPDEYPSSPEIPEDPAGRPYDA